MNLASNLWAGRLPRLPLLIALLLILIFTLTRLGLALFSGIDQVPLTLWPGVFGTGLWFDLAVVAWFLAPVCIYEVLLPNRWRANRVHGVLRVVWLWFLVALLLYAPMMSQINLAPTLVEVLGKNGDDHFFGRSLFDPGPPLERAFISNYQELDYLRDGVLTVLHPGGRVESFRIDPATLSSTPAAVEPKLLEEAIAYYQTAARAFKRGALRMPVARYP